MQEEIGGDSPTWILTLKTSPPLRLADKVLDLEACAPRYETRHYEFAKGFREGV